MKKKFIVSLLSTLLMFSLFPIQAFAETDSRNSNTVTNTDVTAMREEITSKEEVTEEDLEWIEEDFGSIEVDNSVDDFVLLIIRPYEPEVVEYRSTETVEYYRTIGIIVEKPDPNTAVLRGGYYSGASGGVSAYLDIGVWQETTPGTYRTFKRAVSATTTITNFSEYQRVRLNMTLRTSGLGVASAAEVRSGISPRPYGAPSNYGQWSYPNLHTAYSVSSPSSVYWSTWDQQATIALTTTFYFTRYSGGPTHTCTWTYTA